MRQIGGGDIANLRAEKWEIDDPIARLARGSLNFDHWTATDAEPTHRIFVDEQQFMTWMGGLQRPEHLTHE